MGWLSAGCGLSGASAGLPRSLETRLAPTRIYSPLGSDHCGRRSRRSRPRRDEREKGGCRRRGCRRRGQPTWRRRGRTSRGRSAPDEPPSPLMPGVGWIGRRGRSRWRARRRSVCPARRPSRLLCRLIGHSRLGKAADWAAAQDTRFAAALSNESGHGGQSIQRRALGETVAHLEHSFPYWFCPAYAKWVGHDADIPADGNLLLSRSSRRARSTSAPPSATSGPIPKANFSPPSAPAAFTNSSANPRSRPTPRNPHSTTPSVSKASSPITERVGKHDVTAFDWEHYLDFLDNRWGKPDVHSTHNHDRHRRAAAPSAPRDQRANQQLASRNPPHTLHPRPTPQA